MKAFLASLLAILVISIGAHYALEAFDTSAAATFSDPESVRLDPDEEEGSGSEE